MGKRGSSLWLQISLKVDEETAEAICEVFNRYGEGGAVVEALPEEESVTVKTFLPFADERLPALKEALWHLGQIRPLPEPAIVELAPQDWAEAWKAHFGSQHIGKRLVVCPSWQEYQAAEGEVVITLDPGLAFGTGLHPTTRMCLEALERLLQPGMRLLDLGTGSGILAIVAARLGAQRLLALDTDPMAVGVARGNISANGVDERVKVREGSIEALRPKEPPFDLIVANITAQTIADLVERGLLDLLKPEGYLIAGGILEPQREEMEAALKSKGLRDIEARQKGDWVTLIGRRAA